MRTLVEIVLLVAIVVLVFALLKGSGA